MDASGTVVAVGKDCDRLKVGDEVWADVGGVSGDTGWLELFGIRFRIKIWYWRCLYFFGLSCHKFHSALHMHKEK